MSILNADIVRWAGLTKYVIYRKRGAFDSAHSYTLKSYVYLSAIQCTILGINTDSTVYTLSVSIQVAVA